MNNINTFHLLGVKVDSDIKDVRRAYYKLSLIYDPDKGGNSSGGGGSGYTGNFYWNRDKNHDIWDLFDKNLLSAKERKEVMIN